MAIFQLLTFGVVAIYAGHRLLVWMDARGWVYYRNRRGTSAALGNALLQVQTVYQPSVEQVLRRGWKSRRKPPNPAILRPSRRS